MVRFGPRPAALAIASLCVAALASPVVASAAPVKPGFGSGPKDKDRARSTSRPILEHALGRKGNVGADNSFVEESVQVDGLRTAHVRVQQTHRGIPVWGGEAIANLGTDGAVHSLSDGFARNVKLSRGKSVSLSSAEATQIARTKTGLAQAPAKSKLWVFPNAGTYALAWQVTLTDVDGTNTPSIPVLFVDANTGAVLSSYDNLQADTGTGNSIYSGQVTLNTTLSGSTYQMKDASRGNQQVTNLNHATSGSGTLFTDADNVWGNGAQSDPASAGVDAAYAAAETWDYYKNVHGRNGIWNTGVGAPSRVHYGNNYVNAFWDGAQMTYGDGSGNAQPLVGLDVGGHEMSHGVTENTAGLVYSGESGGLNEATSDIFGTAVEWYANNPNDVPDYLIGEEININGNGTPLRYMDKPSKDGASKDCWYSGIGSLNVHYSSGPANHFYYLLSEGSGAKTINGVSYNSPTCNGSTVTGITHLKAEKIWYRALTTYMTSSTNYAAARTATLNAASDLYGGTTSAEYAATCAAWAAVSVGTCGGGGGGGGATALSNGVPVSNLSGSTGAQAQFTLAVPAGATGLSFKISGGTGDADMYVKFGSTPTLSSYDCRPYLNGNAETCTIATAQAGTYYVMLNAYSTYSGVTLVGSYTAGGGGGGGGTELLTNGAFETSASPWVLSTSGFYYVNPGNYPHGGTGYAYGGSVNSGSGTAYQQVTIPSTATGTLTFWLNVTSDETTTATQYDKLYVEVRNTAGTLLATLGTYSNLNKTTAGSYSQKSFSVAAYKGQTVRIQFRATTDSSLVSTFRVDDASLK